MRKADWTEETEFETENKMPANDAAPQEEYADYSEDSYARHYENEEEAERSGVGRKILTVLVIILALVALFFASSKLTSLWLDYRQTPVSYESDAPEIGEDDSIFDQIDISETESEVTAQPPEVLDPLDNAEPEESANPQQSATPSPSAKPSSAPKPQESAKPQQSAAPAQTPTPSKAPISIVPGNPAA